MRESQLAQNFAGEIIAGARKRQRDVLGPDMPILPPVGFVVSKIRVTSVVVWITPRSQFAGFWRTWPDRKGVGDGRQRTQPDA